MPKKQPTIKPSGQGRVPLYGVTLRVSYRYQEDSFYALSILLIAVESLIKNFSIIETKDTNQSPFKRIRAKGTVGKASTLLN